MRRKPSLQDIIRDHETQSFVGRQDALERFRTNLRLDPTEPGRSFLFAIDGQAGSGKSTLLNRYKSMANSEGFLIASADEAQVDLPQALAHLVEQLSRNSAFKNFSERYKVYRQRREEIETDPSAPKGLAYLIARTTTKTASKLAKGTPFEGISELIDPERLADASVEALEFLTKKN